MLKTDGQGNYSCDSPEIVNPKMYRVSIKDEDYEGEAISDCIPTCCCSPEKCYFVQFEDGYDGYFGIDDVEILGEVSK